MKYMQAQKFFIVKYIIKIFLNVQSVIFAVCRVHIQFI